jgi:hypothetical protein
MQVKPSCLFTSCTSHIFGSILQTTLLHPLPSFNQPLGSPPLMVQLMQVNQVFEIVTKWNLYSH